MGKQSRRKRSRTPAPPPVGNRPPLWRQRRTLIAASAVLVLAGLAAGLAIASSSGRSSSAGVKLAPNPPPTLSGLNVGRPPWPTADAGLGARLDAIGLPRQQMEGQALHIHQHLDVYVEGQHVPIPANVGINVAENFLSPIHTHDPTGVIHIESPTASDYTLGQFFAVWGVRFTPQCIGGLCAGGGRELRVYVNGKPVSGDPRRIVLQAHQEIVVAYGTPAQLPTPIPSHYDFAPGL